MIEWFSIAFLGGSGRGSGGYSSRGSNFGSSSGKRGFGTPKKSKALSTLKKVAVVGAVAYGAYKIGQFKSRFDGHSFGNNYNPGYNFNQWESWRKADGFLCRNDNDCNWLDRNLECEPVRDFGWSINVRLC